MITDIPLKRRMLGELGMPRVTLRKILAENKNVHVTSGRPSCSLGRASVILKARYFVITPHHNKFPSGNNVGPILKLRSLMQVLLTYLEPQGPGLRYTLESPKPCFGCFHKGGEPNSDPFSLFFLTTWTSKTWLCKPHITSQGTPNIWKPTFGATRLGQPIAAGPHGARTLLREAFWGSRGACADAGG